LDNLITQGKAEPMIIVMTNGNAELEAGPEESSLGYAVPTTKLPKTMEGSFETHFPEVVKFIDKNYRTKANKKNRAIAGLSMSGFHSLHISKQYPDSSTMSVCSLQPFGQTRMPHQPFIKMQKRSWLRNSQRNQPFIG
jgi:enterochelin esterase-like enzyme